MSRLIEKVGKNLNGCAVAVSEEVFKALLENGMMFSGYDTAPCFDWVKEKKYYQILNDTIHCVDEIDAEKYTEIKYFKNIGFVEGELANKFDETGISSELIFKRDAYDCIGTKAQLNDIKHSSSFSTAYYTYFEGSSSKVYSVSIAHYKENLGVNYFETKEDLVNHVIKQHERAIKFIKKTNNITDEKVQEQE